MRYRRTYSRDPRWIEAMIAARCQHHENGVRCATMIRAGERAFYYPLTKTILCAACGEQAARAFASEAADEEVLRG